MTKEGAIATREILDERDAIARMRRLVERFIATEIDYATFFPALCKCFAPFDPLHMHLDGLSTTDERDLRFFYKWAGGEFGESDDLIPPSPTWRYGGDTQDYSWVDQDKYRADLSHAYAELTGRHG